MWVLPVLVMLVQLGMARLTQVHLPAGQGPPWMRGHEWRETPDPAAAAARAMDALGYGLLVLGPLAMGFRRVWRAPAFVGVFAADCVYFAVGYPAGPAFVSLIVSFFVAVQNGPRLLAWALCPVSYTLAVWSAPIFGRGDGPGIDGIIPFAWPLAVLILAEVVRLARERIVQNQEARAEAERRRHEETRRRASEERLRIAQELHDVLAHNISMINVQASTALHLLDDQPERARPSLSAIKDASKEALGELRSALDVLRQSGERAPRAPTTGLDQLDALVDRTRSAGLAVELAVDGERRTLPPGVDLAAFRIVQEALTNVVRHAQAAHVTVRIGYRPDDLTVEVSDDGRGPSGTDGAGNGIVGMRERAAALGGELEAAQRPGGGVRVRARLPFTDEREPA